MDVLWSAGAWQSVADVTAAINGNEHAPLAYTTIKTILSNLAEKEHVRKRSAGKANEFRVATTRENFDRQLIGDVVGPLLRNHRNPLLAHMADELAADDASLADFERLIAERKVLKRA